MFSLLHLHLLLLSLSLSLTRAALQSELQLYSGPGRVSLRAEEGAVFVFLITPQHFNFSSSSGGLTYRASQRGHPSLPAWVSLHHLQPLQAGLLYGVPPDQGQTSLEVLATDTDTFVTSKLVVSLHTQTRADNRYQVTLKIDNLNIEDVFDETRKGRLLSLFKTRFWPEAADDIHLSFADSAIKVGGRRPLKPSSKDGVVVRLGSSYNFSSSLMDLDRETEPLRYGR